MDKKKDDKSLSYFWSLFHDIIRNDETGDLEKRSDKKLRKNIPVARRSIAPSISNLNKMSMAHIYAQIYIPKYKNEPNKLPFYDEFPLFIPISFQKGRIFAFNIHYLKPENRKIFIKNYVNYLSTKTRAFYSLKATHPIDLNNVNDKLIRSWGETYMNHFMESHRSSVLKVCIRSYLPNHIASRIYQLNMNELVNYKNLNFTFMPVFKRKSAKEIYALIQAQYLKYADSDWSF